MKANYTIVAYKGVGTDEQEWFVVRPDGSLLDPNGGGMSQNVAQKMADELNQYANRVHHRIV